jgi:hypothetical protein
MLEYINITYCKSTPDKKWHADGIFIISIERESGELTRQRVSSRQTRSSHCSHN